MSLSNKKVLITGASGFISRHIITVLLERGYSVVGTVRNQAKSDLLDGLFKGNPYKSVIVDNVTNKAAIESVFKNEHGFTGVILNASPLIFTDPSSASLDPKESVLDPAIEGTKNVLYAIQKYAPEVRNVVFTTSMSAMADSAKMSEKTMHVDETSYHPVTLEDDINDGYTLYCASKKYAELFFWDFFKNEKPNCAGTSVAAPLIVGPQILAKGETITGYGTSNTIVFGPLFAPDDGTPKDYSKMINHIVDIRDVALAHVLSLEKPEAAGARLFVNTGFYSNQQILDIAHEKFPDLTEKLPVGKPGTGKDYFHEMHTWNNDKTNKILGIEYRPVEASITEALGAFLQAGQIIASGGVVP